MPASEITGAPQPDPIAAGTRKMLHIWLVLVVCVLIAMIVVFVTVTDFQQSIFDGQVERNEPAGTSLHP